MSKIKKIGEWMGRIMCFSIFDSFFAVIAFVVIHEIYAFLGKKIDFLISISLIQFSMAICYLRIANAFYWFFGVNLFNFKELKEVILFKIERRTT